MAAIVLFILDVAGEHGSWSVLIELDWRRLINCRNSILMCRNTDVLIAKEVRRFVKGGTCFFWNESANLKVLNAFHALLHLFISAFLSPFLPCTLSLLPCFRSFNLLSSSSTPCLSLFPFCIISSFIFPLYFFRYVILPPLIPPFHSAFPPTFLLSIHYFMLPHFICHGFPFFFPCFFIPPSFLLCFLSSLFSPYFQFNSSPPAFVYGNRGLANTVDSKSRRRTSVYWYYRTSKVLKTNNCARCWSSDFHLYEWLSKFLKQ